MRLILPTLLGLALALSACSNKERKPEDKKTAAAVESTGEASSPDCVRGEPEALLGSRSEFTKLSVGEAQETVSTNSPVKLAIRHFGCTHYALDFEFTWPDPGVPKRQKSLNEAADMLENLPVKETYQPMMKSLVAAVHKMAQEPDEQPLTMSETETLTATTPAPNVLRIRYDVAL